MFNLKTHFAAFFSALLQSENANRKITLGLKPTFAVLAFAPIIYLAPLSAQSPAQAQSGAQSAAANEISESADQALDEAVVASFKDAEPARIAGSSTLFAKELSLIESSKVEYGPLVALLSKQAKAQLCGHYSREAQLAFLAKKAELVEDQSLDFTTLKELRYLTLVSVENQVRQLEPLELKSWCLNQKIEL